MKHFEIHLYSVYDKGGGVLLRLVCGSTKKYTRGINSLCKGYKYDEKVNYYTLVSSCRYIQTVKFMSRKEKTHTRHICL